MADTSDTALQTSSSKMSHRISGRRQSYTSWISALASPNLQHTTSPPPVPYMASPASSEKTITGRVSQVLMSTQMQTPNAATSALVDPVNASEEEETESETRTVTAPEMETKEDGMLPTLDEVSENPITPPLVVNRKPRSIVDGFVSSLRSIPRAVTHSQLHDRMPPSRRDSRASYITVPYSRAGTATAPGSPRPVVDTKYPHQPLPFTVPILFAPPFPHHSHAHAHPHVHGSHVPMSLASESKLGTYESEWGAESRAVAGRISSFFEELSSLPWVSPRVSVDYVPGESKPAKNSSSWYTVSAPSTPSDISHMTQFVPDPWFPPVRPPPSPVVELPGEEGQTDEEDEANIKKRLEKTKGELQERNQALQDLRQIVEHQKKHIGSLETQMEELRRASEENVQRRRSSVRRSLRVRDSLRVSRVSTRRTSARVSRPPSMYLD